MSYGKMAARALEALRFAVNDIAVDGGGDAFVAVTAGVFGDPMIKLGDLDGVGIPAGREVERVPETVVGLYSVLTEDVVGCVAIVAGGGGVVA